MKDLFYSLFMLVAGILIGALSALVAAGIGGLWLYQDTKKETEKNRRKDGYYGKFASRDRSAESEEAGVPDPAVS